VLYFFVFCYFRLNAFDKQKTDRAKKNCRRMFIFILFLGSCSKETNEKSNQVLNDPTLVGTWVNQGHYFRFDPHGKGLKSRSKMTLSDMDTIPTDIKQQSRRILNWVTYNNNFLLINTDKKVVGFSYQISGDTLFMRQPGGRLKYVLRVVEQETEKRSTQ